MMAGVSVRRQLFLGLSVALCICGLIIARYLSGVIAPTITVNLKVYSKIPDFSLIDHLRQRVQRSDFNDRVWIASFIFTRCSGQCPIISKQMAQLQHDFSAEESLRFVSFTVNPTYDTPDRLAEYIKHYNSPDDRWRLLTGDRDVVVKLCLEGFRVAINEDAQGNVVEPITHSVRLVLVDQKGRIRGYYDVTDVMAMKQLRIDTRRLIQGTV